MVCVLRKQQIILFPSELELCWWDFLPRCLPTPGGTHLPWGCACSCCLPGAGARRARAPWAAGWQGPRGSPGHTETSQDPGPALRGTDPSVPPDMCWQGMSLPLPLLQWDPEPRPKWLQAKMRVLVSEKYWVVFFKLTYTIHCYTLCSVAAFFCFYLWTN